MVGWCKVALKRSNFSRIELCHQKGVLLSCRATLGEARRRVEVFDENCEYRDHVLAAIDIVSRSCKLCASLTSSAPSDDDDEPNSVVSAFKEDLSPVTVADFAIQALAEHELRGRNLMSPTGVPLIAEEDMTEIESHFDAEEVECFHQLVESFCDSDFNFERSTTDTSHSNKNSTRSSTQSVSERKSETDKESFWILDPIDGTKGVVSLCPDDQFAIGLALVKDKEPVVGVLGLPNWCRWSHQSACSSRNGILLIAVKGYGSYLMELRERENEFEFEFEFKTQAKDPMLDEPYENLLRKIEVDGSTSLEESTFLISQRQEWDQSLPIASGFLNKERERKPRKVIKGCCGSLIKYAAVALGCASAYVEHPVKNKEALKVWDHAAGVICVEEAGGKVTDLNGGPLRFEARPFFKPKGLGIIASNGKFHNELCKSIDV